MTILLLLLLLCAAGHAVKKGTLVNMHNESITSDERYWPDAKLFKPERFLDAQGKFSGRNPALVVFSNGRRACPGERLAIADLVLILTRLLQCTRGHRFTMADGPGTANLDGDRNITSAWTTGSYRIALKKL